MPRYKRRWFESTSGQASGVQGRYYRNASIVLGELDWASLHLRFRLAERLRRELEVVTRAGWVTTDKLGRRDVVVQPARFTGRASIFND